VIGAFSCLCSGALDRSDASGPGRLSSARRAGPVGEGVSRVADPLAVRAGFQRQLTLSADPISAGLGRGFVALSLRPLVRQDVVDTALLLVSELINNAIVHARTGLVLTVRQADRRIRIEVRDGRALALSGPVRRAVDSEGGRGLALIDALADAWGSDQDAEGKSVWFELMAG
jgi:anti-sigma regulatory factor (Ser/Thr protein kinase)